MDTDTSTTFLGMIEGARGALVFGGGVNALIGEVTEVGDDYVLFFGKHSGREESDLHAIPMASIVYFRFAREA